MVSGLETIPSCLLLTSSHPAKKEILARVASLEEEVEQLRRENQGFEKRTNSCDRKTDGSETSSGGTRGRVHHRVRTNRIKRSRLRPIGAKTTNNHVLTVARLAESPNTTRNGATLLALIEKPRLPVTAVQTVVKCSTSRGLTPADSSKNSLIHSHRRPHNTTGPTTNAILMDLRLSPHTPIPLIGAAGVDVTAQTALSRYDHRLPSGKVGDRFEQLHGLKLSGAAAWHATERVTGAGRW